MAGVYLRYGVITVTNPDGTATSGQAGGTFIVRGADGRDTTRVVAPKDARFIARGSLESVRATASTPRTITVEIK